MSFENFPESTNPPAEQKPVEKKSDYRTILTGILLIALLGTWGYIIWDKSKTKQKEQQLTSQIATGDSTKNELQTELNSATMRLDELKSKNTRADSLIGTKNKDIQDLKDKIQKILNDKNATAAQLAQARTMIAELKGNIDSYTVEIEQLKGENIKITEEKRVVTEQRDVVTKNYDSAKNVIKEKENVIDIGSTLHASGFDIVGLKERGNKEKETTTAKRVDKLRITFNLDENRITTSGNKDIFVCITAPDGKPVAVEALGSGKFVTRDGMEKLFSKKVQVNYTQGQKQVVTVEWQQNSPFQTGDYKIEVYNNGFKIGEGVRSFKKGGLFS
jgi:hypothetical protein